MIKKIYKENERLKKLVYLDYLTKLYNRRGLTEIGERYFASLKKYPKTRNRRKKEIKFLSIIFLDIDDFKKINDVYGHERGDKVLRSFASFLLSNFRQTDIVGRFGGEEFVILLINTPEAIAKKVAEKARSKIESNLFNGLKLTVSVGVLMAKREKNFKELINKADKLMYLAKKRGKNQVVCL
ncbi:MAG: GGDEF domain-containing protein [Minisyncoccia bacterium]